MTSHVLVNGKWVIYQKEKDIVTDNYSAQKFKNWSITVLSDSHKNINNGWGEQFASEVVSKLIGVDVHTDWGVSHLECKSYLAAEDVVFMPEFRNLYLKNPELLTINGKPRDILNGCISKFNFEDIKYYCEIDSSSRTTEKRAIELQDSLNLMFHWIPSNSTLDKIEKQITENNIIVNEELIKEKL